MSLTKTLDQLFSLRVGIEHIDGSLVEHLQGTYLLLQSWGAEQDLCMAGLYHATYGTSGFDKHLISKNQREQVKNILGNKVEYIVYIYCACDRDFFWPQIGNIEQPIFLDRFTQQKYQLSFQELQWFCELTVANEVEIAMDNHPFITQYAFVLQDLFQRMRAYISDHAAHSVSIFNKVMA